MDNDRLIRVTIRVADAFAGPVEGATKSECDWCHEPVWNDNIPVEGESGTVCTRCAVSNPELHKGLEGDSMLEMIEKGHALADALKAKWS
jgi:hypothetical protein